MRVAILGTGRMGTALAHSLAGKIPDLLWASRDPARASHLADGLDLRPATEAEALEADLLIPTLWYRDLRPWLEARADRLAGKLLIDLTNPFTADFADFELGPETSAAEELQRAAPQARIVAAFKNTFWPIFADPIENGLPPDVLVASDDEEAKQLVLRLLAPLPFRFLDAGPLAASRTIERMTLLSRQIALRHGGYPRVSWRLWGGVDPGLTAAPGSPPPPPRGPTTRAAPAPRRAG